MGFLQNLAAKRYTASLRRNHPGPWGLGVEQAENHFAERYGSVPPRSPSGMRGLMELANNEATSYIPGMMLQFASEGHDLDDLDNDAMQAFMEAFQRRLSELFIGLPRGQLLNH